MPVVQVEYKGRMIRTRRKQRTLHSSQGNDEVLYWRAHFCDSVLETSNQDQETTVDGEVKIGCKKENVNLFVFLCKPTWPRGTLWMTKRD